MFQLLVTMANERVLGLPLWLLAIVNVSMASGIAFIILGVLRLVFERRK
jgi:hypothetical protein